MGSRGQMPLLQPHHYPRKLAELFGFISTMQNLLN
jgi:hypothetical protein